MNPFIKTTFGPIAVLGLSLLTVNEASAAPVVALGSDPSAALTGAVRYKDLSNGSAGAKEIQIGASDGSGGIASPTEGVVTWTTGKCVQFSYDGNSTLSTKVAAMASPCVFTSPLATVSKNIGALSPLNYLQITITKNSPSTVNFNTVSLDGDSLGNFTGITGTANWKVTGIDISSGFTLTGTVAVPSLTGSGNSNFVQVDVGSVTLPDNEGPLTSNVTVTPSPVLLNGPATVSAIIDDSTTGNNTIQSAEYSLDGGQWAAMTAQDTIFDEVNEEVEATFTATTTGTHQVCAGGTDSQGNTGGETCQSFLVTYQFDGFFSPIDNNALNLVKAGQAVPAKWRLTDYNGTPIDNTTSFAGLYSYPISCSDYSGSVLDSVEEYAPGSSGLQYNGDGYWQFNWKTPKTYVGTCRAMYVEFDSGATSPVVKFKFK